MVAVLICSGAIMVFMGLDVYKRQQLFKRELLSLGDEIARSLTVHVVDNGRSLDVEGLSGGGVFIHPNPNVGGSGGFARGMIESIHQKVKPTHVLLMDDDVSVSPESIRRTYALLSIRREAYIDAFVSGAMLKLEKMCIRDRIRNIPSAAVPSENDNGE